MPPKSRTKRTSVRKPGSGTVKHNTLAEYMKKKGLSPKIESSNNSNYSNNDDISAITAMTNSGIEPHEILNTDISRLSNSNLSRLAAQINDIIISEYSKNSGNSRMIGQLERKYGKVEQEKVDRRARKQLNAFNRRREQFERQTAPILQEINENNNEFFNRRAAKSRKNLKKPEGCCKGNNKCTISGGKKNRRTKRKNRRTKRKN